MTFQFILPKNQPKRNQPKLLLCPVSVINTNIFKNAPLYITNNVLKSSPKQTGYEGLVLIMQDVKTKNKFPIFLLQIIRLDMITKHLPESEPSCNFLFLFFLFFSSHLFEVGRVELEKRQLHILPCYEPLNHKFTKIVG